MGSNLVEGTIAVDWALPKKIYIAAGGSSVVDVEDGIVKKLLSTWPKLCKLCDSSNTSPLYSAAVQDHLEVVNAILDVDGC
ncbi:hypothetical protein Dimus_029215 [Dionaea muscipula]